MLAGFASAAIQVDSNDLTIPVDYGRLRNDNTQLDISHAVTLTNTGNASENLAFRLNLPAGYTLTAGANLTLAAGASHELTLSGKIPVTANKGINDIGTLVITSSAGEQSYALKTDVKNMLKIVEINIFVDGEEEKSVDSNNEDLKNRKPGETIQLRFRLENIFDNDYDEGSIDGEITLTLDDDDFYDEVDEEKDFDLDAGEKLDSEDEEIVLEFEIPQRAKAGDYKLEITVTGEDENNARYTIEWGLNLEVERENDDVQVGSLSITPAEASCGESVHIVAEVINSGSDRQRHAALTLKNTELGINEEFEFELDSGTDEDYSITKTVSVEIPDDAKAGSYPIKAAAYYDYNKGDNSQTVNLVLKKCSVSSSGAETAEAEEPEREAAAAETEETAPEEEEEEESREESSSLISSAAVEDTTENPFTTEDIMMVILSAAIVLVLALIVLFALILLK